MISSDSVFSPLRDSPGPGSGNVSLSRRTPFTSFSTPPTMSPLTIIREETAREETASSHFTKEQVENVKEKLESVGDFVKETSSMSDVFHTAAPSPPDLSLQNTNISNKSPGQEQSPVEKPKSSELLNVITAFPHLVQGGAASNGKPQSDIR